MRKIQSTLAAVVLAAGLAGEAPADVVVNGDFETGDFTGWTQFGNVGFSIVTGIFVSAPYQGSFQAVFGPVGSIGGITQDLTTVAGQQYDIDFAVANVDGSPNSFSADFGGTNLTSFTNAASFPYTPYHFSAVATSTTTTLRFSFRDDPSFLLLDAVSVTAAAAAVPEPGTLAMVGPAAALGLIALRRRRRREPA